MRIITKEHEFSKLANLIRQDVIRMLVEAGSGHSAGSLGMADVMTVLYFSGVMKYDPQKPNWMERDRLVLSNGHICPLLYTAMAHAGFFPLAELDTLRKFHSRLQGHPYRLSLPGLETTSGPLGSGLSQAAGMAYAAKMDGRKWRIFCLGSDGEHQEGNWWEAVMFTGKHRLSNVTLIIDRNNIQIDGYTEEVMPLEPLKEKYLSFNWNVMEADGHNYEALIDVINQAKTIFEKPTAIIAHTIPGKDIEFMEALPEWHGKPPKIGEAVEALAELRSLAGRIESDYD